MADEAPESNDTSSHLLKVMPRGKVYAGVDMNLECGVSNVSELDLHDASIKILDQHGGTVVQENFDVLSWERSAGVELVVSAPNEPGDYEWLAILASSKAAGAVSEVFSRFSFTVRPHVAYAEVWDVPSAVETGKEFGIRVGIKCSAGCVQATRHFAVLDGIGATVASGSVGDRPWPGTTALYYSEIALEAPEAEGTYQWQVAFPERYEDIPHPETSRTFRLSVVGRAEHNVTVEVRNKKDQSPIPGMHVHLHPFRTFTDEQGVARLKVPGGKYELHVSGFRYFPHRASIEVSDDLRAQVEVQWEERPDWDVYY